MDRSYLYLPTIFSLYLPAFFISYVWVGIFRYVNKKRWLLDILVIGMITIYLVVLNHRGQELSEYHLGIAEVLILSLFGSELLLKNKIAELQRIGEEERKLAYRCAFVMGAIVAALGASELVNRGIPADASKDIFVICKLQFIILGLSIVVAGFILMRRVNRDREGFD